MFHLTLMPDVKHLFEGFSILQKDVDEIRNLYTYPKTYSLQTYYEFIFPCDCPRNKTEEYTIVISNSYNSRSFLICLYSHDHKIYLCIYSYNPWFEILSKLLRNLCSNEFLTNTYNELERYLNQVYLLDNKEYITLPACIVNDKTQELLKNSLKYPFIYDKYILEYLTANKQLAKYNKQLWIEVFWSMLLERPVIFMSKRYQKLTSSLLAAIFFIHPLSWLHKIVSIIPKKSPELLGMNCCMLGIHSCMEPFLEKADYWNEALLVDLDKGESRMVGACENEKETKKRFKVPKYIKKFFAENLVFVDESVSKQSPDKIKNIISNVQWDVNNKEEMMYNEYKKGFHIYSLLFRTVIAILIGHYRECISESDGLYNFDKTKFVEYNTKISDFLELLINSQCFDSFIDERLKIIQNNEDLHDRFDRERLELNFTEKSKSRKHKLEMLQKKIITVINAKSEEDLRRKGKTSTMPNPKKNKVRKQSLPKKTSFHALTDEKASSLSAGSSLLNMCKTKNSSDTISIESESLTSQVCKGLLEINVLASGDLPIGGYSGSPKAVREDGLPMRPISANQMPPLPKKLNDYLNKKAPARPPYAPSVVNKIKLKDGDVPLGRVKDVVDRLNTINLEKEQAELKNKSVIVRPRSSSLFQTPTNSLVSSTNNVV